MRGGGTDEETCLCSGRKAGALMSEDAIAVGGDADAQLQAVLAKIAIDNRRAAEREDRALSISAAVVGIGLVLFLAAQSFYMSRREAWCDTHPTDVRCTGLWR